MKYFIKYLNTLARVFVPTLAATFEIHSLHCICVAWPSGNNVRHINEYSTLIVISILCWLTVHVYAVLVCNSHLSQISLQPSAGSNEYRSKCGDALRLGSKGRYGSFHSWINVWVLGGR